MINELVFEATNKIELDEPFVLMRNQIDDNFIFNRTYVLEKKIGSIERVGKYYQRYSDRYYSGYSYYDTNQRPHQRKAIQRNLKNMKQRIFNERNPFLFIKNTEFKEKMTPLVYNLNDRIKNKTFDKIPNGCVECFDQLQDLNQFPKSKKVIVQIQKKIHELNQDLNLHKVEILDKSIWTKIISPTTDPVSLKKFLLDLENLKFGIFPDNRIVMKSVRDKNGISAEYDEFRTMIGLLYSFEMRLKFNFLMTIDRVEFGENKKKFQLCFYFYGMENVKPECKAINFFKNDKERFLFGTTVNTPIQRKNDSSRLQLE
jgi:hypothetical protein